jgi:hypothetical protein
MGWDYVSELRPITGLLFIPGWYVITESQLVWLLKPRAEDTTENQEWTIHDMWTCFIWFLLLHHYLFVLCFKWSSICFGTYLCDLFILICLINIYFYRREIKYLLNVSDISSRVIVSPNACWDWHFFNEGHQGTVCSLVPLTLANCLLMTMYQFERLFNVQCYKTITAFDILRKLIKKRSWHISKHISSISLHTLRKTTDKTQVSIVDTAEGVWTGVWTGVTAWDKIRSRLWAPDVTELCYCYLHK